MKRIWGMGRMGGWLLFGLAVLGLGAWNWEPVLIIGGAVLVAVSAVALATMTGPSRGQRRRRR